MTTTETESQAEVIIEVTPQALRKVLDIRDAEPDPETLGLRIEVTGAVGVDYQYDLSLDPVDDAGPDDSVVEADGLTVIVPAASVEKLRGATLDLPANAAQGGLVIRNPNRPNPLADLDLELEGSIADKVKVLLEKSVNPSLAAHGGFATLVGVKDETSDVYLTMGGGCQGCAMSRMTLTNGIRQAIKEAIPEVNDVVDVTDHAQGENPFYS
ncbi:MAG: Fe/S biosis protein NfuA [Acidimicrobiia bacterium]|jgi:Fe/S biogenesis protein NfuA|nr:Fe/S biosis protein NfuA [Acidimicrobiia bacterium]